MGKCHDSAKIFAMLGWREDGASIFRRATFEAIDKPDRLVKKKKKKVIVLYENAMGVSIGEKKKRKKKKKSVEFISSCSNATFAVWSSWSCFREKSLTNRRIIFLV